MATACVMGPKDPGGPIANQLGRLSSCCGSSNFIQRFSSLSAELLLLLSAVTPQNGDGEESRWEAPLRVAGEMSCQPTCMRFNYNQQLLIEGATNKPNKISFEKKVKRRCNKQPNPSRYIGRLKNKKIESTRNAQFSGESLCVTI